MAGSSPFYHSGPVVGENFCDREEEMDRLLAWVGSTPPTSVAVHGPERIGKSSLLRQLCEVEGPKRCPNRRFIYLDMQRVTTPQDFGRRVLKALGKREEECEGGWEEPFEEALLAGKEPVVLCLDEFGKVLAKPAFDADFYDFLRSLTQTGKLALVIATLRPPSELTVPSGADVSRFFNIFRPFPLGPFTDEAAQKLVERGISDGEKVRWVLENVREKNFPYHLQLLAAYFLEAEGNRDEALRAYREALKELEEPREVGPEGAPLPAGPGRLTTFIGVTLFGSAVALAVAVLGDLPALFGLAVVLLLMALGGIGWAFLSSRSEE